jgi:predicted transcriptional regulator
LATVPTDEFVAAAVPGIQACVIMSDSAHVYSTVHTRDQHAAVAMTELLEGARDPATVLTHFVEHLDEDNRRQLSRLLRRPS